MKQAVQVTVLGQPFSVRTEASPAEVQRIAAYVNDQVAEIIAGGQTVDTHNAAILALMKISGAYLRLQEAQQKEEQAAARLRGVLAKVEAALPGFQD